MDENVRQIVIFDTTLRDGEQAAGCRLGATEKLVLAQQLARLNVDVIEVGFPISSPEDYRAVKLVAEEVSGPVITGLSRAVKEDIKVCGEALANAKRGRIHTGLGVSEMHMEQKLRKTRDQVVRMGLDAVKYAREFVDDIEFYMEDAGRADPQFLLEFAEQLVEAGITVLNVPDTTGYSMPEQWGALIKSLVAGVPALREGKVTVSVHCHNDLGLAVANTLAAVYNGATQVECTINGIGERAGNAALEEIVLALKARKDFFNARTNINLSEIFKTSQLVIHHLGLPIAPNKPIVGPNAFAHSSGIHVDGVLKNRSTYEILDPAEIGASKTKIILTARTGRHGVEHRLSELGYDLTKDELEAFYQRFLEVADRKNEVNDFDLVMLMEGGKEFQKGLYHLENLEVLISTEGGYAALVKISERGKETEPFFGKSWGNGPVDAAYKAVNQALDLQVGLSDYHIRSVDRGSESLGEVTVKVTMDEVTKIGHGNSLDIVEASVKAYLNAINKLIAAT
jgi:2-isopropylmalate synthase